MKYKLVVICFLIVLLLSGCDAFKEGFSEGVENKNGSEDLKEN